jgi:hypothetical protein
MFYMGTKPVLLLREEHKPWVLSKRTQENTVYGAIRDEVNGIKIKLFCN